MDSLNRKLRVFPQEDGLADMPELSEELRSGTRALEGLKRFRWSGETIWLEDLKVWGLSCKLSTDVPPQRFVPETSSWWIQIDPTYPAGSINFFPAKDGGIVHTFPHQRYNGGGDTNQYLWRTGNICLSTDVSAIKRYGFDVEPRDSDSRLRWNICRAQQWLKCAARGELLARGDRFELPDFPEDNRKILAFCEIPQSLTAWQSVDVLWGFTRMLYLDERGDIKIVAAFEDEKGKLVTSFSWGTYIQKQAREGPTGVWVRLPEVPILEPWQAPATWAELERAFECLGLRIREFLPGLLERLRHSERTLSQRPRHPLLVGFPIPRVVGGPMELMHWVGFELPPLAEGKERARGFRPNTMGRFESDLQGLRRIDRISWCKSENWNDEALTGRGSLAPWLRNAKVLLIGVGAVGSAVAEILVRGGVRSLLVFDGDTMEAGNLTRHSLTLENLLHNKAEAVVCRLNQISPHGSVVAVGASFPSIPEELKATVEEADLVLDCSADDSVLFHLERYMWKRQRVFVSLSLGLHARRLYYFEAQTERFPRAAYVRAVEPWVKRDWCGVDVHELPWEGLGCWNPLMPAGADDVWFLASSAVRYLNAHADGISDGPQSRFVVFEQIERDGEFLGLRIASKEEAI